MSGNCLPCDPPPPPPGPDCCEWETVAEVPQSLVGVLSMTAIPSATCACEDEIEVQFDLLEGSVPPEWHQVGTVNCAPSSGTGSDDASTLLGLEGMRISCGGGSGSGSGTGTGGAYSFFLQPPGCAEDQQVVQASSASCSPLTAVFDCEIEACCGAYTGPPLSLIMHLEVMG